MDEVTANLVTPADHAAFALKFLEFSKTLPVLHLLEFGAHHLPGDAFVLRLTAF
jgi:hypothetical protein